MIKIELTLTAFPRNFTMISHIIPGPEDSLLVQFQGGMVPYLKSEFTIKPEVPKIED